MIYYDKDNICTVMIFDLIKTFSADELRILALNIKERIKAIEDGNHNRDCSWCEEDRRAELLELKEKQMLIGRLL